MGIYIGVTNVLNGRNRQGLEQGRELGLEQGRQAEKEEIVRKSLIKHVDIDFIAELTGSHTITSY